MVNWGSACLCKAMMSSLCRGVAKSLQGDRSRHANPSERHGEDDASRRCCVPTRRLAGRHMRRCAEWPHLLSWNDVYVLGGLSM